MGYGSFTVTAPLKHHKTLQNFGKLLKHGDETAEGILTSIANMIEGEPYTPYIPPKAEAYTQPEVPIEPAVLSVLIKIAAELGTLKDKELVNRLERQVQITIDAYHAKVSASARRALR